MKKYIVYVANDGAQFDNEAACLEWEYKISHLPKSIHWYAEDGTPLIPTTEEEILFFYNCKDFTHCIVDDVPSCFEDLDFMKTYWGFLMPARPGDFYWDKCAGWDADWEES